MSFDGHALAPGAGAAVFRAMSRFDRLALRIVLPALAVALAAPAAEAQIVYTNAANITTPSAASYLVFELGSNGNPGSASTTFFSAAQFALSFDGSLDTPQLGIRAANSAYFNPGSPWLENFSLNTAISPGLDWYVFAFDFSIFINNNTSAYNSYVASNYWVAGTTGYVGLRIGAGGSDYRYGWAQISYNNDRSLSLHDFAYEQSINTAINAGAGAIPEPSTYAALAGLLAGGAAFYAKRRKQFPLAATAA